MGELAFAIWLEANYLRNYAYCRTRREYRGLLIARYGSAIP